VGDAALPAAAAVASATPAATPAATPVAAPAVASVAPAAAPLAAPGTDTRLTVTVGGVERRWALATPPTGAGPVDLVVLLHGVGRDGSQMRGFGFENLAIPAGVAIAYPDAAYGAWNDGRPGADVLSPDGKGADDVAFLRALVVRSGVAMRRPVRSVGVIGFSNGAMMAARVACDMSDVVSVVAIVAGSAPEGFQNGCKPQVPVSVAVVAAKGDPIVPFNGGQVASFQGRPRGRVSGVEATVSFWSKADACGASQAAAMTPTAPAVGATAADACTARRHVARYATDDATHDWRRAGGFDTTAVVWSFVRDELPRAATTTDLERAGLNLEG
jgi:polyhydroxybutyrate depolymerase